MSDIVREPVLISEYIKKLQSAMEEHGDIPVVESIIFECTGDAYYELDVSISVDFVEDGWKIFDTEEPANFEKVLVITKKEEF